MNPYPEYKDSGLDLVGAVPAHWSLKRGDGVFDYRKEIVTTEMLEGGEVLHYSIPSVQEFGEGQIEEGNSVGSSKLKLEGGELLVSKLNPRKGTVTLVELNHPLMVCSSEFVPLVPVGCDPRFAYYLYSSEPTRIRLSALVESATKSHQRANPADIYKMWNAFPPLEEQKRIASYLDRKTAQIDTLIQKKQALIALLREQRTALINRAVTKGLDPDVPMKDSGVEWLGAVPAHWGLTRVKAHAELLNGFPFKSDYFNGSKGTPLIRIRDITSGTTETKFNSDFDDRYLVHDGDVLIGMDGDFLIRWWTGGTALLNQRCCCVRPQDTLDRRYLYYVLRFPLQVINDLTYFTTVKHLSSGDVLNITMPFPPLEEQHEVSAFIERKTRETDELVEREVTTIRLLRELRTSLISQVVTGKIDVRNSGIAAEDPGEDAAA